MLIRRPPSVRLPTAEELLSMHPFLESLPQNVKAALISSARQLTKLRGSRLLKKGLPANGVWLIVAGSVIQVEKKSLVSCLFASQLSNFLQENGESSKGDDFDDEDTAGEAARASCIGLYEVLRGIQFLTSVRTVTAANCFFLDKSALLAAFRESEETADAMWKVELLSLSLWL